MQTVYIRFTSEADRERGFYELATRARIASLPFQIYQIPIAALTLLENESIGYRRATDEEVKIANDQVRSSDLNKSRSG